MSDMIEFENAFIWIYAVFCVSSVSEKAKPRKQSKETSVYKFSTNSLYYMWKLKRSFPVI